MDYGTRHLSTGDPAPLFVLSTTQGGRVALHERRDKAPVLLLFFRGFWCECCRAQLNALKAVWSKIAELGVEVYGIMAHGVDATDFIWRIEPPFLMLVDQDQKVMNKYGVADPKLGGMYTISRPATFVVDHTGHIRFAYVGKDKADRPDISAMLEALHHVTGHEQPSRAQNSSEAST